MKIHDVPDIFTEYYISVKNNLNPVYFDPETVLRNSNLSKEWEIFVNKTFDGAYKTLNKNKTRKEDWINCFCNTDFIDNKIVLVTSAPRKTIEKTMCEIELPVHIQDKIKEYVEKLKIYNLNYSLKFVFDKLYVVSRWEENEKWEPEITNLVKESMNSLELPTNINEEIILKTDSMFLRLYTYETREIQ